jgi:hypothetical protein
MGMTILSVCLSVCRSVCLSVCPRFIVRAISFDRLEIFDRDFGYLI